MLLIFNAWYANKCFIQFHYITYSFSSFTVIFCYQQRRGNLPDPVVDISDMYNIMLRKDDIGQGYFTTTKYNKMFIEYQEIVFQHLYSEEGLWVRLFLYVAIVLVLFLFILSLSLKTKEGEPSFHHTEE
jgi:hypothetical protein